MELPGQALRHGENGRTDAYIRPHELDISRTADGGNCLLGKVVHINPAGSVVKVRLMAEDFGLMINVDITPERYKRPRTRSRAKASTSPPRPRRSSSRITRSNASHCFRAHDTPCAETIVTCPEETLSE